MLSSRLLAAWNLQKLCNFSSTTVTRNFVSSHQLFASSPKPSDPTDDKKPKKKDTIRAKTPIGKLDELEEGRHPYQEKEPLPAWPDNTNPHTGEVGGPRGPEPTRYGDWERKGRVTDF